MNGNHTPRWIVLGACALACAVLLVGMDLNPARAEVNDRRAAVAAANQFVSDCVAGGGEPEVEMEDDNSIITARCEYDERYEWCVYHYDMGKTNCGGGPYESTHPRPGRWDDLPPLEPIPITATPDGTEPPLTPIDTSASPANHDQNQSQGLGKQTKHGKKGKKGGKHSRR